MRNYVWLMIVSSWNSYRFSWLLQGVLFSIGSAFLYYVNHFKLYSSFCASHSKAQKVLHPSKFPPEIPRRLFFRERRPSLPRPRQHARSFAIDNSLAGNNCPTSIVTLYRCIVPGKFSDLLFVSTFREWMTFLRPPEALSIQRDCSIIFQSIHYSAKFYFVFPENLISPTAQKL